MCNKTACNPVTEFCTQELDSQNAALAWGPLTASHFTADFEVIAWSGAEAVTPSTTDRLVADGVSFETAIQMYPLDSQIWARQVAADNMSVIANYSSWIPQVNAGGPEVIQNCTVSLCNMYAYTFVYAVRYMCMVCTHQ